MLLPLSQQHKQGVARREICTSDQGGDEGTRQTAVVCGNDLTPSNALQKDQGAIIELAYCKTLAIEQARLGRANISWYIARAHTH